MEESWQVYADNGETIDGLALSRNEFTDEYIMSAAHVWLWRRTDNMIEVMIQQRAKTKQTWPGYKDISAAGHINAGETPVQAAVREAKEEIGLDIEPSRLNYGFSLRTPLAPNEIDHVFNYEVASDFVPNFDDGEVEAFEWLSLNKFESKVANPGQNNIVDQGTGYFRLLLDQLHLL